MIAPPVCAPPASDIEIDAAGFARVRASARAPFRATPSSEPSKVYVVGGDPVLTGARAGDKVCATFAAPHGGRLTSGWLEASALTPTSPPAPRLTAWFGPWRRGPEAQIDVAAGHAAPGHPSGELRLQGWATWGATDPHRLTRGGVNIGGIAALTAPTGDHLAFSNGAVEDNPGAPVVIDGEGARVSSLPYAAHPEQEACRVRMRLVGAYLLVHDNDACGGHNVTFSGVYRANR